MTVQGRLTSWSAGGWRRLAAVLAAAGLGAAGMIAAGPAPAYALGKGEVCMFLAPTGAHDLGHVGWGWLVGGSATWTFGSTENLSGAINVGGGSNTDSWSESGSFSTMTRTFANKLTIGGHYYHAAGYYTLYRCENTPVSSVGAANTQVHTEAVNGYSVLTNNCLDKAIAIYQAYDAALTFKSALLVGPTEYFVDDLPGFGAPQIL